MHSPFVHLMLAFYLAIWSPAMCCCAIKSALASGGAMNTACCASRKSAMKDASGCAEAKPAVKKRHCCSEPAASDQSEKSSSEPQNHKCRCHENSRDLFREHSGVELKHSTLELHLPPAILFIQAPIAPQTEASFAHGHEWSRRAWPPPQTLLAQRCLLLI